jgi:hypothetical protein
MKGDVMACCLYAGTGVGKITDIRSARVLVRELAEFAKAGNAATA